MKKVLAVVALLVMTVSVVFAGSVYLDSGVSFTNGNSEMKMNGSSTGSKMDISVISLPLEVGYRQTFGNGLVVSGSAGVFFNLNENKDGLPPMGNNEKFFPTQFSFKAQAGYGLKINEKLSAEFLGGLSYAFGKKSVTGLSVTYNTISIVGEAGIKYNVADSIALSAGTKMSIPFTTFGKMTMGGTYLDFKASGFVFNITPFVGVAYQFWYPIITV